MLDEEAVQMMLAKGTYLVPTLFAFQYLVDHGEEMGLSPVELSKIAVVSHHCATSFQMAARAGVKIATGSDIIDGTAHGRNAEELVLMVQCGFTPMQAIVAATRIAAEVCRVDDKVGILRAGKLADLLVVDGNPLDNIAILADSSRLLMVMKDGKPYVNKLMKSSTRKIKGHIE
jgi:imidazolonepropionase-like amidohydrolase